jgi:hypothetical protein
VITLKFTKGKRFYANYYISDLQVENHPKYVIVNSSVYGEQKPRWMLKKYSYTPDIVGNMLNWLEGYRMIWDGSKTVKELKEMAEELEKNE